LNHVMKMVVLFDLDLLTMVDNLLFDGRMNHLVFELAS
jgi:hypothetical protein